MKTAKKLVWHFLIVCPVLALAIQSHAIDTMDWEGLVAVRLHTAENSRKWLEEMAAFAVASSFPKGTNIMAVVKKGYDKTTNCIVVKPPKNNIHDITQVRSFFSQTSKDNKELYGYIINFRPKAFPILSVLSRYKTMIPNIETESDLSKKIKYTLSRGMSISEAGNLMMLAPVSNTDGDYTLVIFTTKDGVSVFDVTVVMSRDSR